MFYNDHNPPHFHVRYNEYNATINIEELSLMEGRLPPRIYGAVIEWATIHKIELLEDWELARREQPLKTIPPLE